MTLSSRAYLSLVLGGVGLICVACLVVRWQVLAASTRTPQLGPVSSRPIHTAVSRHDPPDKQHAALTTTADPNSAVQQAADDGDDSPRRDGTKATDGGRLDVNHATQEELDQLPGIGPVLAGRIVETRERLGGFASIEQLSEVDGIGEATLAELRPLLQIESGS